MPLPTGLDVTEAGGEFVIRDRRPYFIKRFSFRFQHWYAQHFIRPQLASMGKGCHFIRPWNVEVFGSYIDLGCFVHVVCASDSHIRLVTWGVGADCGRLRIGDYSLISPGVRLTAAKTIDIGPNCMLANRVYITDADWHGIYNRLEIVGEPAPVVLKENVWVGDSAIICKGVTIGENSVIGAGAVVTTDVPDNCVAAGNPARVVKQLDPGRGFTKRAELFADPAGLVLYMDDFDREYLKNNTTLGWIRSRLFPRSGD